MSTKKKSDVEIFVHNRNVVRFVCPYCKLEKDIDISKIKDLSHWGIKGKCTRCKNDFTVSFNLRKYFRKNVNLEATMFTSVALDNFLGDACVTDMSLSGVGFTTNASLVKDSVLTIRFILDNDQNTEVIKEIKIESIRGNKVGASFIGGVALDGHVRNYIVNK